MSMNTTLRATVATALTAAAVTLAAPAAEAKPGHGQGHGYGQGGQSDGPRACKRPGKGPKWCGKYWYFQSHPFVWEIYGPR